MPNIELGLGRRITFIKLALKIVRLDVRMFVKLFPFIYCPTEKRILERIRLERISCNIS